VGGETADLGFELVPERLAFALCYFSSAPIAHTSYVQSARTRLLEGALVRSLSTNALYVFANVVFGIDVRSRGADASNCSGYGCCCCAMLAVIRDRVATSRQWKERRELTKLHD
jgi:hypothetical protein